jgi:GNAT superfamily N-acetyltransferase
MHLPPSITAISWTVCQERFHRWGKSFKKKNKHGVVMGFVVYYVRGFGFVFFCVAKVFVRTTLIILYTQKDLERDNQMIIRKLAIDDMDLLVQLRIDFLLDEKIEFTQHELEIIKTKCKDFFISAYKTDSFIAFVAEENGTVLSTAFMTLTERPPRKAFIPYRIGTVYNVLTYEHYRRKGIATKVLDALLDEAKLNGISTIDLWATTDGEKLYNNLGFWSINLTPMRKELYDQS